MSNKKENAVTAKNGAKNSIKAINETNNKSTKKAEVTEAQLVKYGQSAVKILETALKSEANYILAQIKRYVRIGEIVAKTQLKGDNLEL